MKIRKFHRISCVMGANLILDGASSPCITIDLSLVGLSIALDTTELSDAIGDICKLEIPERGLVLDVCIEWVSGAGVGLRVISLPEEQMCAWLDILQEKIKE